MMQTWGGNAVGLSLQWNTGAFAISNGGAGGAAAHQVHHLRSHLALSLSSDAGLGRRSQGLFTWVLYHLTGVQTSKGENPAGPKPYIRQQSLYLVFGI